MIILEFIWKIIHAVLKVISFFIQMALALVNACFSFVGIIVVIFCVMLGAIFVIGSFPCLIIGWIDGAEFWKMLIFGALIGVIPLFIVNAGHGIINKIIDGLSKI